MRTLCNGVPFLCVQVYMFMCLTCCPLSNLHEYLLCIISRVLELLGISQFSIKSYNTGFKSQSARDFVKFYETVKQEGTTITNKDILKFSKLFEDEITLDNMTRLVRFIRFQDLGYLVGYYHRP